jgi:hypothetical protein
LLHAVLRRLLLRRLPVLLRRGLPVLLLLRRGLPVLLLRRLSVLRLLLRRGLPVRLLRGLAVGLLLRRLPVARLRLPVSRGRLAVLRLTRLLRGTGHQLRALERLLLLRLLGLTLLGESGLTGILRSTRRVAGGLIHRDLLFRAEGNRNAVQENVISP